MVNVVHQCLTGNAAPQAGRTYLPGDIAPPKDAAVPFGADDFDTEERRRAVMEPWRVTDEEGRVLPGWRDPVRVFERSGRISAHALALTSVGV